MTAKSARTVWTVATVGVSITAVAVLLFFPGDMPRKGLVVAAVALGVNAVAWLVTRGSGVRPPWEGLLSTVFQDKQVDAAEEMRKGYQASDAGDFAAAASHFDQVLQAEPSRAEALFCRGNARERLGDLDAALTDYTRALSLRPELVSARQARANLYLQRGDLDRAIEDYTEFLREEDHDASAYRCRGIAYTRRDNKEAALADLKEAIRLDPTNAEAFFERGKLHESMGDVPHALNDYTEAGRLDPTGPGRAAKHDLQQRRGAVR